MTADYTPVAGAGGDAVGLAGRLVLYRLAGLS